MSSGLRWERTRQAGAAGASRARSPPGLNIVAQGPLQASPPHTPTCCALLLPSPLRDIDMKPINIFCLAIGMEGLRRPPLGLRGFREQWVCDGASPSPEVGWPQGCGGPFKGVLASFLGSSQCLAKPLTSCKLQWR